MPKEKIDPKQVSPKFLSQFLDAASFEDEDNIQEIWADLLLKESLSPGSISLRTISSLKSMSKEEALLFQSLFPKAICFNNEVGIYNDSDKKESIDYIIKLADCGILVSDNTLVTMSQTISPNKETPMFVSPHHKLVLMAKNDKPEKERCTIPILPLTKAGQDILTATVDDIYKESYVDIGKDVSKRNKNIIIQLFSISAYDEANKKMSYTKKNLLNTID